MPFVWYHMVMNLLDTLYIISLNHESLCIVCLRAFVYYYYNYSDWRQSVSPIPYLCIFTHKHIHTHCR